MNSGFRLEHDFLGEKEIPNDKYYGVQTLRAIENFNVSGVRLKNFPEMVKAFAIVKQGAALANKELGILDPKIADAIVAAAKEVETGKFNDQFDVDMIQGGAGTSTNMNANEVITNRALELLGHKKGEYQYCHPNNHVNLSQSTNDVYPTAVKLAIYNSNLKFASLLDELVAALRAKGKEFAHIIKLGRTQLQDAVPMTLGQEFEAYAVNISEEAPRLQNNANLFLEMNMGATAIGTGINAELGYAPLCEKYLRELTGLKFVTAGNLIEATNDTGAFVIYSSAVKRLAVKLSKMANDFRLLSSGPRGGFNEINLPQMQPGSSIMPGKVNPVMPELINQIAFRVFGNDLTVTFAAEAGQLELNVMEPIIVFSILESLEILTNGIRTFIDKCVKGITANEESCLAHVLNSTSIVTALNPILGYEMSASIAKEALESHKTVYELILERKLMTKEDLEENLKPENMIAPRHYAKK